MIQLWDGTWRHYTNVEYRHPQEFVEALKESFPTEPLRSDLPYPTGMLCAPSTVGVNTGVATPQGAAYHLFVNAAALSTGIGDMVIGSSFQVT